MVELMSASLESHASSLTSNLTIVHHPCAIFSQLTRHDDKFSKKKKTNSYTGVELRCTFTSEWIAAANCKKILEFGHQALS